MRPPRLALLTCTVSLWLAVISSVRAEDPPRLPQPMPVGPAASSAPCSPPCEAATTCLPPPCDACATPCPQICPHCPAPRVVVELSQPEVHFAAPTRLGMPCRNEQAGPCGSPCASAGSGSFFSWNVTKIHSRLYGGLPAGAQPVTTVIPAFATATIPIAFQTTRFAAATEFGLAGTAARGESAAIGRNELQEIVRDAVSEAAKAESKKAESVKSEAAPQADACAELKTRLDKVDKRLDQIQTQVDGILEKLKKLP